MSKFERSQLRLLPLVYTALIEVALAAPTIKRKTQQPRLSAGLRFNP